MSRTNMYLLHCVHRAVNSVHATHTVGPTHSAHSLAHVWYLVFDGLMEVLHKGGVQPKQETQELATLRVGDIIVN